MLISINNSKDLFYTGSAFYSSVDRANDGMKAYGSDGDTFGEMLDKKPSPVESLVERTPLELYGGTAWLPMIEDLPDITAALGRTYKYAVLNDDWFNASKFKQDTYDDPVYGENDMYIKEVTSETDNTEFTVERSWDNRDPGEIKEGVGSGEDSESSGTDTTTPPADSGEEDAEELPPGFYTETELEQYSPVLDPPKWLQEDTQYSPSNYFTSFFKDDTYTGEAGGVTTYPLSDTVYTPYTGNTWYYNTDVQKVRQDSFNPHNVVLGSETQEEMILRALEILGDDILLRDEYVFSCVYGDYFDIFDEGLVSIYPDAKGGSGQDATYFGYFYSNTSVMDTHAPLAQPSNSSVYGNDSLITNDYIIQCIYRAMGVNCLKTQVFFYADKEMDIDFTPIASELTIDVKNVNQIQNRVDVFNTRTNLDQYWAKAVSDGLVKETGVLTYNTLDAAYKPWAVCIGESGVDVEDISIPDPNDTECSVKYPAGTWFEIEPYGQGLSKVEAERGSGTGREKITVDGKAHDFKLIDYARTEHMTLAEFCIVLKKAMDIYGEEILTEKEQTLLLLNYGTSLPYELPEEELTAVKYLMAKGILNERMNWSEELKLDDMLIILARVADPATRLNFKEITITYDQALLDAGYYPANVSLTSTADAPVSVMGTMPLTKEGSVVASGNYKEAEYIDYMLIMKPDVLEVPVIENGEEVTKTQEVTPYFKYDANSANVEDLSSLYIAYKTTESASTTDISPFISSNCGKDFDSLKVMGLEYLNDGYAYLHIRVRGDCVYKRDKNGSRLLSEYNPNYVVEKDGKHFLIINSSISAYAPQYWMIGVEGGVYRENKVHAAVANPDAPDEEKVYDITKYVFHWTTDYYEGGYSAGIESEFWSASSPDEGIGITEFDKMSAEGIYPTTVVDIVDGKVCKAAIPKVTYNKSAVVRFDSFDNLSAGCQYVDRQRMLIGYASYLVASPYLEEDETGPLGIRNQMQQEYANIVKVKLAETSGAGDTLNAETARLIDDLYYGGDMIVKADSPTEPLDPNIVQFYGFSKPEHLALYVIQSSVPLEGSPSELFTYGSSEQNAEVVSAYVKQNSEMLVDTGVLQTLMNSAAGDYEFTDFLVSVVEKDPDTDLPVTILLSFSLKSGSTESIPYNIYLYKGMNLIAVNNMITQVPANSVLFTQKEDGDFLINYRAVKGWQSGFDWSSTDGEGTLMLNSDALNINRFGLVLNPYSGVDELLPLYESEDGLVTMPLSAPYILSNYLILATQTEGTFMFVVKNNDNICESSIMDNIAAGDDSTVDDYIKKVRKLYGPTSAIRLSDFLGISLGGESLDAPYVVAHYNLTDSASIFNSDSEKKDPSAICISMSTFKDSEVSASEKYGKVFYNNAQGCWYYVLPEVTEDSVELEDGTVVGCLASTFDLEHMSQGGVGVNAVEDFNAVRDTLGNMLNPLVKGYYECEYPLPIFNVVKDGELAKVLDISCNTYEGAAYGEMLAGAYSIDDSDERADYGWYYDGDQWVGIPITAKVYGGYAVHVTKTSETSHDFELADTFFSNTHYDCPVGLVATIMGLEGIAAGELKESHAITTVYTGNIRRRLNPQSLMLVDYYGRGVPTQHMEEQLSETDLLGILNSSATKQNVSYSNFAVTYTDTRDFLLKNNLRGSLEDRVQTPVIDWSEFSFNRLVHDVDNFASIFLIIVLNILPRICMFVFIIMIGLATVANVKPWRKFCTNVFDPYKFFTFGHATVLTIDTKLLLISSIIATATFALFMDGTLLHLISWFVQFVSAFITR